MPAVARRASRVSYEEYEVLLVLDDCTDSTEMRARDVAASYPAQTSLPERPRRRIRPRAAYGWRMSPATGCTPWVGRTP